MRVVRTAEIVAAGQVFDDLVELAAEALALLQQLVDGLAIPQQILARRDQRNEFCLEQLLTLQYSNRKSSQLLNKNTLQNLKIWKGHSETTLPLQKQFQTKSEKNLKLSNPAFCLTEQLADFAKQP